VSHNGERERERERERALPRATRPAYRRFSLGSRFVLRWLSGFENRAHTRASAGTSKENDCGVCCTIGPELEALVARSSSSTKPFCSCLSLAISSTNPWGVEPGNGTYTLGPQRESAISQQGRGMEAT